MNINLESPRSQVESQENITPRLPVSARLVEPDGDNSHIVWTWKSGSTTPTTWKKDGAYITYNRGGGLQPTVDTWFKPGWLDADIGDPAKMDDAWLKNLIARAHKTASTIGTKPLELPASGAKTETKPAEVNPPEPVQEPIETPAPIAPAVGGNGSQASRKASSMPSETLPAAPLNRSGKLPYGKLRTGDKVPHTKNDPCEICGGYESLPHGQGTRCYGHTKGDYVDCSRENFAGELDVSGEFYTHVLYGKCRCGVVHSEWPYDRLLNKPASTGKEKANLTLEALAEDKKIPVEFLLKIGLRSRKDSYWGQYVSIPYVGIDGKQLPLKRRRLGLSGNESRWGKGDKAAIYGLGNLEQIKAGGACVLVEGESDCWTLWFHRFPALGIPGCKSAAKIEALHVDGIDRLYIYVEPDQGGEDLRQGVSRQCAQIGYSGELYVLTLDVFKDPNALNQAVDADTFKKTFQAAIDNAAPINFRAEFPKKVIRTNHCQLLTKTEAAINELLKANTPPVLFVRSGAIARIRHSELGRPIIETVNEKMIRNRLSKVAYFERATDKGKIFDTDPDTVLCQNILAEPSWEFPPLQGITEVPILRADGSIVSTPGYDKQSKLIYMPMDGLQVESIPHEPTSADVEDALLLINEAIGEFPYVDTASRANALALMLTPILRPALGASACIPLGLIDATKAGTGKSLIAKVVSIIATGRPAAMFTAPFKDEEWKKSITSTLDSGATIISIDNIDHALWSPSLCAALTTRWWNDRRLGHTEQITIPQDAVWFATGNNISLRGDLPRRCFWIRLDAETAQPWKRTGFKHPNLEKWTSDNRGRLIGSLLTIIRAWYADKCPEADTPKIGSFEEWSETLGAILSHSGVEGFLGNEDEMYERGDEESPQWAAFLEAWDKQFFEPITVSEIIEEAKQQDGFRDILPDAIADAVTNEKGARSKIGKALRKRVGAFFGEYRIVRDTRDPNARRTLWKVEKIEF